MWMLEYGVAGGTGGAVRLPVMNIAIIYLLEDEM